MITVSSVTGSIAVMISSTMVNVAIPSIMGAYGVEQTMAQWTATAFYAALVASQLLNAWVVSAIGERAAFCSMLFFFTIGAFICATSTTIEVLIGGRIFQGIAAGILVPLNMSCLIAAFPEGRRGFAIGLYSMGTIVSPGLGPVIGGFAIEMFSWRHMFLVPLPMIGIAFIMGLFMLPHRTASERRVRPFNWTGYALVMTAIICIVGAIGNGQRWGWGSDMTMITFLIGFVAMIAFLVSQLYVEEPILDPTLFKNAQFSSAVMVSFAFGAATFGVNYAIPVMSQAVLSFTPIKAGAILIPAGCMLLILIPTAGWIADRVPNYIPIMIGCVIFSGAMFIISDSDVNTAFWTIALLVMLSRFGHGIVITNMGRATLMAVPKEKLNQGIGTFNFIRQLGGAFGVSSIAVMIETRTAFHSDALAATQTAANPTSQEFLGKVEHLLGEAGVSSAVQHSGALDYLGKVVYAQALTMGFQDAFMLLGVFFALMFFPCLILRRAYIRAEALGLPTKPKKRKKSAPEEDKKADSAEPANDGIQKPSPAAAE
jgi:EmrB/QacA subfamily drug resistance transporter